MDSLLNAIFVYAKNNGKSNSSFKNYTCGKRIVCTDFCYDNQFVLYIKTPFLYECGGYKAGRH